MKTKQICLMTSSNLPSLSSLKNRGKAHKWCATRQVDKLNNENFFLPRYSLCTGLFMQRFLVFVHGIPVV